MMPHRSTLAFRLYLPVALLLSAQLALASETSSFTLDSEKDLSGGKLEGSAVRSDGVVVPGLSVDRIALQGATMARALLTTADGTSYVGTGTPAKVLRVAAGKVEPLVELDAAFVTALAHDGHSLFAAASPDRRIYRITSGGKAEVLTTLPDTEHIWALAYDAAHKRLFAATGPHGKIFSVAMDGRSELYFETGQTHVMTLASGRDGLLFAGTDGKALLLEIRAPGTARVLYDFEGNEVTAIALTGDAIAVAVNNFPVTTPKSPQGAAKLASLTGSNLKAPPKPTAPKAGTGQLWRVTRDGEARKLFEGQGGHISAVGFDGEAILVAGSKEGELFAVEPNGRYALVQDVDEQEILALDLSHQPPRFVTGEGAALYSVRDATKGPHTWTSRPLDSHFGARFGELSFRKQGRLVMRTRSGNTEIPDDTWSPWSEPLSASGPIRSPAGRFLQLRAELEQDAALLAVRAFYLPTNQAPQLATVQVEPYHERKNEAHLPTAIYRVSWALENTDEDVLRYRLTYRPESAKLPRPLFSEDVVFTGDHYDWNTEAVPDGVYLVEVDASDELSNEPTRALRSQAVSEPVVIDNHAPLFSKLARNGQRITGTVTDTLGPIRGLYYKLDHLPWAPLLPQDGLLDQRREQFSIALPQDLAQGSHVVAVQATDDRNNLASEELEFQVR